MNPHDWGNAYGGLEKHPYNSCVQNSMGQPFGMSTNSSQYCDYSRYTVEKPHNGTWKDISSTPADFYREEPRFDDPDGEPLDIEEEDSELARKRQELREIEERILMKRASIALKAVEPFANNPEQSSTRHGESLRDRVNLILQQRHSVNFLSKVQSCRERVKPSSLFEDHPLKLRVKALMRQRRCDPHVLPKTEKCVEDTSSAIGIRQKCFQVKSESAGHVDSSRQAVVEVPDATLPPPPSSAAEEEPSGFQRFLSVLNKGVDIDLLSKIVTADSEDLALGQELLKIQESTPELDSGERRTEPAGPAPPAEKKADRSRPESSKKRRKKEVEAKAAMDEQQEQLQNILKTLGLSLEVEEMSRLADRTQERLYGKKQGPRGGQGTRKRGHKDSLSPSSSSSSGSTSRSRSPSPHSKHSQGRREDGDQDTKTLSDKDMESTEPKETSTYSHHPYPQGESYPASHSADFSADFSGYGLSQYSGYADYESGAYAAASSFSDSTYTQGASLDPSAYPYSHFDFPGPAAGCNAAYPRHNASDDVDLLMNPDLSQSEGQTGSAGRRCLTVVSTKPSAATRCLTVVQDRRRKKKCRAWFQRLKETSKLRKQVAKERHRVKKALAQAAQAAQAGGEDGEEAKPPTEEQVRYNLRKRLQVFNQKVKETGPEPEPEPEPARSLTPELAE